MKKRKGNSLRKIVAEMLSVVLITGMVSGAAPMNAYAEENAETENMTGSNPFDGTESETTDITGELPEGAAGETEKDPAEEPAEETTTDSVEEPTEEEDRSGDTEEDAEESDALPEDETALAEEETALMEETLVDEVILLEDHIHDGITYEPWTGTESLPAGGNWYLTENITLSTDGWSAPDGATNLCLNGKTITLAENAGVSSPVIRIGQNSQFGLYDHVGGGKITGGTDSGIQNDGTFDMYGGEISGNRSSDFGGGVVNKGAFYLHNGKITNNVCQDTNFVYMVDGGGVYNDGIFHMFGGEISDNTANYGGGVKNSDTLIIDGGIIADNVAQNSHSLAGCGGGIYNDGTFIINDGEVRNNSAYLGQGVYNRGSFVMYKGKIAHNESSDGASGGVCNETEGTFDMYGGEVSNNFSGWEGGGILNHGVFNLYDGLISNNRTLNANGVANGGGVSNDGTFNMFGGKITGNSSGRHGGGVFNWGRFKMLGGEISGNIAADQAGGVGSGSMSTIIVGGDAVVNENKDRYGEANVGLLLEYSDPPRSTVIAIDSDHPLSGSANIGITIEWRPVLQEGRIVGVTASNAADYSSYFHSDNPNYVIQNGSDNTVQLMVPLPHTHQWADTWDNSATHHWHNCTVSGCMITNNAAKDGYAVHTEDGGTVMKEPTDTEEGIRTYKCSICGYEVRTEAIPATGTGVDKSDDGDNSVSDNHTIANTDSESVDVPEDIIDTDTVDSGEPVLDTDTETPVMIPEQPKDPEPKTADTTPVELYATLAMISGLTYVILYFADRNGGMTEETKQELVSKLIRWAKQGKTLRRLLALSVIFVLLVYYHSIGKQGSIEWKEAC